MRAEVYDVAVLGAGPVGLSFALAMRDWSRNVVVLERRSRKAGFEYGTRPIALSYASRLILERIGVWPLLAPTPIEIIHVSQSSGFGRTRFTSRDAGVSALGYVVPYAALEQALVQRAAQCGLPIAYDVSTQQQRLESNATHLRGSVGGAPLELATRCIVHAEGLSEAAREKHYAQDAIVGVVRTEPAAATTAFERFTPNGPLALLPMAGHYGLVWAMLPGRATALVTAPDEEFLEALGSAVGGLAGRPLAIEQRTRAPLSLRVRPARVGLREVFIGNAAQTLHPVGGQGFNLGLRDAWELASLQRDSADPGDPRVLVRYASRRRLDAAATVRATDLLAGAFLGDHPLLRLSRGGALAVFDSCAPVRRFFARRMIFGPSAMP